MLDHLLEVTETPASFLPVEKATPQRLALAQAETDAWLKEMGVPDDEDIEQDLQRDAARKAFKAVATAAPTNEQKQALLEVKSQSAYAHLQTMLTAYDWEFVHQAKELRGLVVTKLVEHVGHADAKVRLRALEMLGKVTEVGLFTTKVEVTKKEEVPDTELEERIRAKIEKLQKIAGRLQDVTPKDSKDPLILDAEEMAKPEVDDE